MNDPRGARPVATAAGEPSPLGGPPGGPPMGLSGGASGGASGGGSGGASGPPPDLPPVPRPTMSRFAKVVIGLGVIIVGGYTAIASTGWEPAQPQRDEIPASVRSSPGGYRSYHFWHSGYRGGK